MRILVADLASNFGGTHRVMVNLLGNLPENTKAAVVDPYMNENYSKHLSAAGIRQIDVGPFHGQPRVGGMGKWYRPLLMAASLSKILSVRAKFDHAIQEFDPDIVHTNQKAACMLLGSLRSVRSRSLVYHCHGLAKPSDLSPRLVRLLNQHAVKAIGVSQITADLMAQAGVRRDILEVCYNAVDADEIRRIARIEPTQPLPPRSPDRPVAALAAAVQPIKGQIYAVEAVGILKQRGLMLDLWMVGGAPPGLEHYRDGLIRRAEQLGVRDQIHLLGWRDDVYQVTKVADLMMLASTTNSESFGMVLTEAMALAKPCVAIRIGGMPEVIEEGVTGMLAEPSDAESLATVLGDMLNRRDEWPTIGQAGRQRVEEKFAIPIQVRRMGEIWKAALDGKNRTA
jgi:hypothetical protein